MVMTKAKAVPLPQHAQPVRLLLVDDHEVVRVGLRTVLGLAPNIRVVGEAATKETAVTETLRVKPDVVLMDIRLPDGSASRPAGRSSRPLHVPASSF